MATCALASSSCMARIRSSCSKTASLCSPASGVICGTHTNVGRTKCPHAAALHGRAQVRHFILHASHICGHVFDGSPAGRELLGTGDAANFIFDCINITTGPVRLPLYIPLPLSLQWKETFAEQLQSAESFGDRRPNINTHFRDVSISFGAVRREDSLISAFLFPGS